MDSDLNTEVLTDHVLQLGIGVLEDMLAKWNEAGCPSDTLLLIVRKSNQDKPLKLVDFRLP